MSHRLAPLALPLLLGLAWVPEMGRADSQAPGSSSTSTGTSRPTAAPARGWHKSELYFGARLANGTLITPVAWEAFLAEVITPAFPDGLTVIQANGQMRGANGVIRRQPTWVVVILRPVGSLEDQRIQSVISSFRGRFQGAELMHVEIPVAQPQFFGN
jgi:hypothetical protein